jgi:very-short-patch-repair endonuclease
VPSKRREKRAKTGQAEDKHYYHADGSKFKSKLEFDFYTQWMIVYPALRPTLQLVFDTIPEALKRGEGRRQWSSDFAWIPQRVIVECEGGVYTQGRHTRGAGYSEDCDKYNAGTLAGWKILRFTTAHLTPKEISNTLHIVKLALGD